MDGVQVRKRGLRMRFADTLGRLFRQRTEEPTSRKRFLIGSIAALVVGGVALWLVVDVGCLNDTGTTQRSLLERLMQHGVLRLTFAGTPDAAQAVLTDWERSCGAEWQSLARIRLWWVFAFIIAYCLLTVCVVSLMLLRRKSSLMRMFSLLIAFFITTAGVLGATANIFALSVLANGSASSAPAIARFLVLMEMSLLLCTLLYVTVGVPVELFRKSLRRTNNLYKAAEPTAEQQALPRIIESVPKPSHKLAGAEGLAAQLAQVREEELEYITHHRHPNRTTDENGDLLVGLALSGGGIRAATTGLGALQALAHLDVLPFVDYVSSVSGGGYITSALSSLGSLNSARLPAAPAFGRRSPDDVLPNREQDLLPGEEEQKSDPHVFEEGDAPAFGGRWGDFPFRSDSNGTAKSMRAAGLIAHLRTHGNFLIARRGVLTRDTLRAIGNVLNGIVFSVGGFLLTMFAAAALYLLTVFALSPDIDTALMHKLPAGSLARVTPPAFGALDSTQVREYSVPCDTTAPAGCVTKNQSALRAPSLGEWVSFQVSAMTLVPRRAYFSDSTLTLRELDDAATMRRALNSAALTGAFATVLALVALLLVLMVFRDGGYLADPLPGEAEEDVFDKAFLWFQGLITLAFVVIATFAWRQTGLLVENRLVGLWLPLAVLVGARVTGFFIALIMPQVPVHKQWTRRFRTLWGGFQAAVVYALWASVVFALLAPMMFAVAGHGITLAAGSVISLVAARLLTRTNGGKEKGRKLPPALVHFLLAIAVVLLVLFCALLFGSVLIVHVGQPGLWAAALVALGVIVLLGFVVDMNKLSLHYFYRDRLAETYMFSELPDTNRRLWTFRDSMELPLRQLHGDLLRPRAQAEDSTEWRNPAPYHLISAAINLAGSRDLTRKDRKSGYWLFSKLYCGSTHTGFRPTAVYRDGDTKLARAIAVSGAAASSGMGFHTFFAQAFATTLFNVRLGYWTENPYFARSQRQRWREKLLFWPAYMWREVTMQTTDQTSLVNLSDGGHTGDNVGIYPLLQRRCKVIIAIDAEQDSGLAFGSFTEAIRHAYVDEGILVDIDMSMIRPDPETGYSRSHCAIGRILYPDKKEQASWLIYLKNSLTGDEPEPVLNYKSDASDFPHESTGDQFFTDAQFESYRALGEHIVNSVFARWTGDDPFTWAADVHAPRTVRNEE